MHKGRLEAFSDGVFAIIITIMVLELKPPHGSSITALMPMIPALLSYILSFVYIGIYWNNHHHMFQAVKEVNGAILWANLHLLFWLSLMPAGTNWLGETHFATEPVMVYGAILMFAGIAYYILAQTLVAHHGPNSTIAKAIGRDKKGKVSVLIYLLAIPLSLVKSWIACLLFVLVAVIWLIPDRRIERNL